MLYRCCKKSRCCWVVLESLFLVTQLLGTDSSSSHKSWAKGIRPELIDALSQGESLFNEIEPPSSFSAEEAKKRVESGHYSSSSSTGFDASSVLEARSQAKTQYGLDDGSQIFSEPEAIYARSNPDSDTAYTLETCQRAGPSQILSVDRILDVTVDKVPEQTGQKKVCLGHDICHSHHRRSKANKSKSDWEKKLGSDPTVENYSVWIESSSPYKIKKTWTHVDDASTCDHYTYKTKVVAPASTEETDVWSWSDESSYALLEDPDSSLIAHNVLESGTRLVDGVEVTRPCWRERWVFEHGPRRKDTCASLIDRGCVLVEKVKAPGKANVWEMTFKCFSGLANKLPYQEDIIGIDIGIDEETFPDSDREVLDDFSQAVATVELFAEMKRDIEAQGATMSEDIQLFRGEEYCCERSILGSANYDCCFVMGGLAEDLRLARCTAEEKELSKKRSLGVAHEVGKRDGKVIGITTRDEWVFCCFPTKLSRVFHEEARKQLGIGWGDAKHPLCRGLTIAEIEKLDLTKLDLSEALSSYEERLSEQAIKEKVRGFTTTLGDVEASMRPSTEGSSVLSR